MIEAEARRTEFALLLVDGEVIARHLLADYLRHCGYDVIEAASTDEAMVVLNDASVSVAGVLCALPALGSSDGFRLAHWVRDNMPRVEIILAGTLDAAAEAAGAFCEQGPRLMRPYESQAVVQRIHLMREQYRQRNAGQ